MPEKIIVLEEDKQDKGLDDKVDQEASESIGLSACLRLSASLYLLSLCHFEHYHLRSIKSTLDI